MVSIADYDFIACDYSRGPLYRLSDADMGRFEQAIQQRPAAGRGVAGFFRSHTRKGISLDADDLAFFQARFREPHHVALLVRPFATKASTAGLFIWENGKVNGDASYLEFPFRSSELGAGQSAEQADSQSGGHRGADAACAQRRRAGTDRADRLAPRNLPAPGTRRRARISYRPSAPAPPPAPAATAAPAPCGDCDTTRARRGRKGRRCSGKDREAGKEREDREVRKDRKDRKDRENSKRPRSSRSSRRPIGTRKSRSSERSKAP